MKFTLSNIKNITDSLELGDDDVLKDFLNSFKGNNQYEKFINIIKSWETQVSPNINFNIDGNNMKIQIRYLIENFSILDTSDEYSETENLKYIFGIPSMFSNDGIIDFDNILKEIDLLGTKINFSRLTDQEKKLIVDNLPPIMYNHIVQNIEKSEKVVRLSHPSLKSFSINFLSNEPFIFIKSLVSSYDTNYCRDIIFHLSKRIDGQVLMNSTISDIEFYIEKYNDEMKNSSPESPNLH